MKEIPSLHKIENKLKNILEYFDIKKLEKPKGRKLALAPKQLVLIGIYWKYYDIGAKKSLYEVLNLVSICSYKTLVVNLNFFAQYIALILQVYMKCNQSLSTEIKHIDSTELSVCLLKNSKHHKTMEGLSSYGHGAKDYYYGLKFHLVTDLHGLPLNSVFTPANVHDTKPVMKLCKDIYGIIVGDAGYISKELLMKFGIEGKRKLLAKPKRNMKKLASMFDSFVYSTRMLIETNFRCLKIFRGFVTSKPRSVDGYVANFIYSLASHFLIPKNTASTFSLS